MTDDLGKKISEFEELSDVEETFENKIMLVAEPCDGYNIEYIDRYVTFQDFEKIILSGFVEHYGMKDMIYENREDYARSDHQHSQYNRVNVDVNGEFSSNPVILDINVGNKCFRIRQNFMSSYYVTREEIGELRFVAVQNFTTNIDINADDFDGWVFANGKTYRTHQASDFSEAKSVFITSQDGMSFTVPLLSNFILPSLEPISFDGGYDTYVKSNTMENIPTHSHKTKIVVTGETHTSVGLNTTLSKKNNGKYLSRGKDNQKKIVEANIQSQMNVRNLEIRRMVTSECGVGVGETHPTYNMLPVMIYIGKRQ